MSNDISEERNSFTLLEVIVAIGVAGVGIMSMIGLLYTIVTPGKGAAMDTRVALASTRISSLVADRVRSNWTTHVDVDDGMFPLPVRSGGAFNKDELFDPVTDPGWIADPEVGVYSHGSRPGLYKLSDGHTDFSIRVWQEQIVNDTLSSLGTADTRAIDDDHAIQVFMEISHPMSVSYLSRDKWYYSFTVLNPEL